MTAQRKATLAAVAAQAGVSAATVSMILSEREGVSFSPETVQRVHNAAATLGYVRSASRPREVSFLERSTVLVICPNVTNPYYSIMVQSIEHAAHTKGYDTLLWTTYREPDKEFDVLQLAVQGRFAGVVFTMMPQAAEAIERLNRRIPVVVIGDRSANLNVNTVEMNNYSAGSLIARHMIELGHKHIAYISTTLNAANSARVRRLEGLRDTYRESCPEGSVHVSSMGITPQEERSTVHIEHRAGYDLTCRCLANKKITAFVAVNDMVAQGVLHAVYDAGLTVPLDYSVCGFDNVFPGQPARMGLTTVEHYIEEKGRHAFDILHAAITGTSSPHNITRVEFKHQLVVRESTAPPCSSRS